MANIRIEDLPPEVRQELGYAVADKHGKGGEIAALASQALPTINEKIKPLEDAWRAGFQPKLEQLKATPVMIYGFVGALLFFHLLFSYCCQLICLKAKQPPSLLVWLPVLQIVPLLRAAGMSGWWFLACFIPILNIVAQILWCVNIAKARGKSVWVGVLLILPLTNLLAFLYLAFSSEEQTDAAPKYKSMALQTA